MACNSKDEYFLTKEYQRKRNEALLDRTKFTDAELEELDIGPTDGTGRTNEDIYFVDQINPVTGKPTGKKIDLRKYPDGMGPVED